MPIKIPNKLPATETLINENIFVITETRALTQDIRPLKILLLNLMPTKIDALVRHGDFDGAIAAGAMNCMECGACTYACPAKRELTQSCRVAKAIARSKKS